MPYRTEPLRPSRRWPHVEWWVPLMAACSSLQRADPGLLLSALDLSGGRARVRASWDGGPEVTVAPGPDTDAEGLRVLLEGAAPGLRVRPVLPGHDREFWEPPAGAPVRARYAWLLERLSVDSTHWRMKSLDLVGVTVDPAAESVDVASEVLDGSGTVVARVPLLAGRELVCAPDWIVSGVREALARRGGRDAPPFPDGPPVRLVEPPG